MKIVVGQILFDLLNDIVAFQKGLQLLRNFCIGVVDERPDNRVITGIFPVTRRLGFWILLQIPQIVHHVPGAVDIQLPEVIAVVPGFHIFSMVGLVCVDQNLVYLFLREAKVFIQMRRRNRIRNKVVGPSEDTLFGNA